MITNIKSGVFNLKDHDIIITNGDSTTFGDDLFIEKSIFKNNDYKPSVQMSPRDYDISGLYNYTHGWPRILGDYTNKPLLNIAQCGSSNEYILKRYMDLLEPKINFDYHVSTFPKDRYFIQKNGEASDYIYNFDSYQHPLFITQLSFSHRYSVFYKDQYYVIHPGLFFKGMDIKYRSIKEDPKFHELLKTHFEQTTHFKTYFDNYIKDLMSIRSYIESKGHKHIILIFYTESDILPLAKDNDWKRFDFIDWVNDLNNVYLLSKDIFKFHSISAETRNKFKSLHPCYRSHKLIAGEINDIIKYSKNSADVNSVYRREKDVL